MNCETYHDLVAPHIDGVLTPAEQLEVEGHLALCEQCRRLFAAEQRFRAVFAARRLTVSVPAAVEQRLRRALATEREAQRPVWGRLAERLKTTVFVPRFGLGLVAAAGLLVALLLPPLFSSSPESDLLTHAMHSYQSATQDQFALDYPTAEPQELQATLNSSGQLDFITHVLDLQSRGYRLRGGKIEYFQDRPLAMAVYDGKDGQILCLRQRGPMPPMPSGATQLHGGYLYTRAGYTLFVSEQPDHFCTLVSRLPQETFLYRLALLPES